MVLTDELDGQMNSLFVLPVSSCQVTGYSMVLSLSGWTSITSALPQWPKLYASINFTQCYTFILPLHWHRWPTADDTSVYNIICCSWIGTSTCKLKELLFCFGTYIYILSHWYYSINSKYAIINGYLDKVLKYSSTQVLKYSSTKPKLKYLSC